MAFEAKTDYCALATIFSDAVEVRDDSVGLSAQKYQPTGDDGSFVATEVYGEDEKPSNSYGLKAEIEAAAGDLILGKVTTVGSKKYALASVEIATAGGSPVQIKATAQQVEDSAEDSAACHYEVPAFNVTTKQHAQKIFASAFTVANGTLTQCTATIGCNVNPDKIAGRKISSDIAQGVITIKGTLLKLPSASADPTVTAGTGWKLTQPPDCTNPEEAYKSFEFNLQMILARASE